MPQSGCDIESGDCDTYTEFISYYDNFLYFRSGIKKTRADTFQFNLYEYMCGMDRHRSHKNDHRNAKRKRRHSSSTPESEQRDKDDRCDARRKRQKDERFERLERIVESLDRRSQQRGSCVHRSDEQMIPLFDPSKDDLVIERWIEHVDELAVQYDWDDRAIMRLIPSRLKGHARQWYGTRQQLAVSWAETKELLKQHFRKSVPFSKLFKEAALYESFPGQALGDYCFQKLDKLRKLDIHIPDKYLIDAVIGGITDANVARTVRSAQHVDANALYAFMTALDNVAFKGERNRGVSSHKRDRSEQFSNSSRQGQPQAVKDENITSTAETADKNTQRSRVECFNCGMSGHIAKKCRKPRIECEQCRRLGHRGDKCPFKKDVNAVKGSKCISNLYERAIWINDHKVKGLIDTGSACTLLRVSIVEKYNMAVQTISDVILRGFAGQAVTSSKSTLCDIRIMEATARVKAVVVSDSHLIYDAVIGRDFLEQKHIIVIKRRNELLFRQIPTVNNNVENSLEIGLVDILSDDTILARPTKI